MQSRGGSLVASVTRASSSQACFVLFSAVESGKKAICGNGKRALNLPKAVTHRAARVPLQRGAPEGHRRPALATSAKEASEEEEKIHAAEKAPCSPKRSCQPVLNHSSCLPGHPLSNTTALFAGHDHARAAGKLCVPGMQPKPEPGAGFSL